MVSQLRVVAYGVLATAAGIAAYLLVSAAKSPPPQQPRGSTRLGAATSDERRLVGCATSPAAVLPSGALPGFRVNLNGAMTSSPRHVSPLESPPADVSEFLRGRLLGYLTPLAYEKPYITQSQEYESQHGYPITTTPSVPLQGQIVEDNPNLLEYTQLTTVFRTSSAALEFETGAAYDPPGDGAQSVELPGTPRGTVAAVAPGTSRTQETIYHVDWTAGDVVLDIYARGGRMLTATSVSPLVSRAVAALQSSCGGNLS